MKKLFSLMLAATSATAFAKCGKKETTTTGSKTGALAIIVSEKSNEFFSDMIKGAKDQVGKYSNKNIQVFDSESKSANEIKHVKTAISNGAKVILFNIENSETSKAAVKHALAEKIKVILLDRTLIDESVDVDGAIFTDNKASTKSLGIYAKDYITKKDFAFKVENALQLQGPSGHSASIARDAGWPLGFTPWYSVVKERGDYKTQKAYDITKTRLTSNPDINFIFAENDNMAIGAMKVFKEKFPKKTLIENNKFIFGFDGTKAAKKAVDTGDMVATVVQEPYKMGQYGVDWAMKLLGEKHKNDNVLTAAELADEKLQLIGTIYSKK